MENRKKVIHKDLWETRRKYLQTFHLFQSPISLHYATNAPEIKFVYVKSGSPTHSTLRAPKSQSAALCPDFNLEYFWPYRLNCSRSIFVLACIDKGVIVKTKMYTLWCIISGNSYDLAMVMMAMIGVWRLPIPLWPFILQGKEPAIFVPRRKLYFAGFWKISEMIDINYWVCAGHNNVTCLALEWFMYIYWIWS